MQHAINETAKEMADTSYLYYVSGLQQSHDSIRDGIKSQSKLFQDHTSSIMNAYSSLTNFGDFINTIDEISGNPADELKSLAFMITAGAFEDIKTELCIPFVKLYIKKYLRTETVKDADERMKNLNIVNGYNGLDFSLSNFFEDGDNDIDIIVRYRMDIPVPVKILPELVIVQRATVKAWLGGDEAGKVYEYTGNEDDIWSLGNFERGNRIRTIFGANMPNSFPVIAKFDSGNATMIKSMDLTANTYKDSDKIIQKISEYIANLESFNGQEEPWGRKGIVIKEYEIKSKCLLLVIPKNPLPEDIRHALDECVLNAAVKGITLRIETYGYKNIENE